MKDLAHINEKKGSSFWWTEETSILIVESKCITGFHSQSLNQKNKPIQQGPLKINYILMPLQIQHMFKTNH